QPALRAAAQKYAHSRTRVGAPQLYAFRRDYPRRSDIAELLLTDNHGLSVLASARPARALHRDEAWWPAALRDGAFEGYAPGDSSPGGATVQYAVAVRAPGVARPVGVLRAAF